MFAIGFIVSQPLKHARVLNALGHPLTCTYAAQGIKQQPYGAAFAQLGLQAFEFIVVNAAVEFYLDMKPGPEPEGAVNIDFPIGGIFGGNVHVIGKTF
jgi:hypothetical protein